MYKVSIQYTNPFKRYRTETIFQSWKFFKAEKGHNSQNNWWILSSIKHGLHFMIIYLCIKFQSNTPILSKDIARKPKVLHMGRTDGMDWRDRRTGRTDRMDWRDRRTYGQRWYYMPHLPPHWKWRGHKKWTNTQIDGQMDGWMNACMHTRCDYYDKLRSLNIILKHDFDPQGRELAVACEIWSCCGLYSCHSFMYHKVKARQELLPQRHTCNLYKVKGLTSLKQ